MPGYFSGKGDAGYTDLLGKERVAKSHPRPAAYGELDEASAALGLARALATSDETQRVLLAAQRDLYHIMSEVASLPDVAERLPTLGQERIEWLEAEVERFGAEITMPKGFVVGGDSPSGAALDLARTVVRRAERATVELVLASSAPPVGQSETESPEAQTLQAQAPQVQGSHGAGSAQVPNPHILAYLNRLSSLCFVLALWENQNQGLTSPTMAKTDTK